ncbi:MAG: sigma-54 dependent transcriptional regulator [Acidobacteriia bacterium]|nr:sigma-54 dependent transcriptional regulator [Terriglobia bacterium]
MAPSAGERILLVDDSPDTLEVLERNLTLEGYSVATAPGVAEAVRMLRKTPFDVVVTDLKMPGASGLELVRHVRDNHRYTEVLMITGYPTVESAVQAVKIGAEDYLSKPFTAEELAAAVERAVAKLRSRRALPVEDRRARGPLAALVGSSGAMRAVSAAVERAAASSAPVTVFGEHGTGKSLVARVIHLAGARSRRPFVRFDCEPVPGRHLARELIGEAERGSGARWGSDPGLLAAARGGTLVLEGFDEGDPELHKALARVVRAGVTGRSGARGGGAVSSRVIVAVAAEAGDPSRRPPPRTERGDVLPGIEISLPPLRERITDVPALVEHFARRFAAGVGRAAPGFTERTIAALMEHVWPGNVGELANLVRWLVARSGEDSVDVPDLPALLRYSAQRDPARFSTLAQVEAAHIRSVLAAVGDNRTRAAEILGIDRKTLREKVKRGA